MSDETPTAETPSAAFARYARQIRFAPWGEAAQRQLAQSRVLIVGCGALGTVAANTLVRAGVGEVRVVDRDFVELTNLQRQVLFDEDDVAAGLPKAVVAAEKLRRINSQVAIEPIVADVTAANIEALCAGVGAIVDGTDNFETRFLINDASVKLGIPWVYGGCVGSEGQTMTILPGDTPCLRCLMPEPPAAGMMPTCDTAGILGPVVNIIASLQAQEALKILSGRHAAVRRTLVYVDLWTNQLREMHVAKLRESSDCPTCRHGKYPWFTGERGSQTAVLCGRNAVQIASSGPGRVSLEELAAKLAAIGSVTHNPFLVRAAIDRYVLTVFPDGRAIVAGTDDPAEARTVYARYIGQ